MNKKAEPPHPDDPTWTPSRHANNPESPLTIDHADALGGLGFGYGTEESVTVRRGNRIGWIPGRFIAHPRDPTIPYDIYLKMSAGTDHRFTVDELTVRQRPGGPPVSTSAIRRLPLPTLCKQAVNDQTLFLEVNERDEIVGPPLGQQDRVRFAVDTAASPRRRRRGPRAKIADSELPRVAEIYRVGRDTREGFVAVAEAFGVGRSTAARAVQRARAAGLLDEEAKDG